MRQECPHGIVAGTCVWCMADALEYESKAIEVIRHSVLERESEEARRKVLKEKGQRKGS